MRSRNPIGGQSAPPSLKNVPLTMSGNVLSVYRGAVRPPFIEETRFMPDLEHTIDYRGAVRPPFIEERASLNSLTR